MSIKDFLNKIKHYLDIDIYTILCLFIIIIVGFSSFGLGRLSMNKNTKKDSEISIIERNDLNANVIKREYVASKNGKLYYRFWCKGINKINVKNRVWFSSSTDAVKSGYKPSKNC